MKIIIGFFLFFLMFPKPAFAEETNYTYTNQEQDKSGLMYYDSRYYDPDLGRFLQPDSVDVPNKYAYVSNDPVNYTDPTGHWEDPFFIDLSNAYVPDWQMGYGDVSGTTAPAGSEFPLNDAVELCCRLGSSLLPIDPISAYDTGEYISEGKFGMAAISGIGIAGFGKWGNKAAAFLEKKFLEMRKAYLLVKHKEILSKILEAGTEIPAPKGTMSYQLMDELTKATGDEIGLYRNSEGVRMLRRGSSDTVNYDVGLQRIIAHTHPYVPEGIFASYERALRLSEGDLRTFNRYLPNQKSTVLIAPDGTARVNIREELWKRIRLTKSGDVIYPYWLYP